MRRIVFMVLRLFYIAPIWVFKIWYYGKSDKYTDEQRFMLLKRVTTRVNKAGRVTIDTHGIENLPSEDGFIMFGNHQGLFDVLTYLESMPRPFSTVMKKEVADVFLVKQVRILLRALPMDREDIRQSMRVIQQMSEEVKEGRNYQIFPEGTRSKKGNQMIDFKAGSFKSAVKAKCPIVPVAIIDSYKAFDTGSIAPVTVQIHYLEPLYYDEYKGMKTYQIADEVKQRIEAVITRYASAKEDLSR